MSEPTFVHENGDHVVITCSGERAEVIGRADYANDENSYYLRYKAGDGRAVEQWWGESAISAE